MKRGEGGKPDGLRSPRGEGADQAGSSIQRLAEARGIKLRRVGLILMGLCPFHKDTNPSLSIDPVRTSGIVSAVSAKAT